ncbi:alpha/beta hydrolase [Actinomadura barringtoniae]|uniref:Alpha/beta hydrolase n=1 Tax=Actinomadura barringtoniae TaxID=1427535 RepID=A0A939PS82_9ACTN|nr:alpha/beta hydrolase [Actinomadura barringtoniae]MBO2454144.1 alpha/beta hydrolase [Actinomadura barringtoniae]
MPYGYLFSVALIACGTAAALYPLRRPERLAGLTFRAGIVPNEVPFMALFLLLGSTLIAAAQQDLGSLGAKITAGVAVAAAVGLVVVIRRQLTAGPSIENAFRDALGGGWRESLAPDLADGLRRRLPYGRILVGLFIWRRDVKRIANLSYGDAGKRNRLDVYRHRSAPKGGPVLVYFHGGGYYSGRKNREARPLLNRLAGQGWVCISANYRLRPKADFLDHLTDAKKVIAWAREHGHEYGADTDTLFMSGSSAGAHMTALCALTQNDPAYQAGFETADTSITGAICLYGYYGDYYGHPEGTSTPMAYVREDAPPFLVVHGDADSLVPVQAARDFVGTLRGASANPVIYAELPGAQHSFDLFHSLRFDRVVDAAEAFAAWVRSRQDTDDRA